MAAAIPRVIHRCWFGPFRMPNEYRANAGEWRRHGYEVVDWSEADVAGWLTNGDIWDRVGGGVNVGGGQEATGVAVQRADIASYEILYRAGGIYANCDIVPLRPLHDLLGGVECFTVVEQAEWRSNALMGATAGHPALQAVIDELPARYHRMGRAHPMNEVTGPHLLTAVTAGRDDVTVLLDPAFPYLFDHMALEGRPDLWPPGDWWVEHRWGHKHPELIELESRDDDHERVRHPGTTQSGHGVGDAT